MFVYSYFTFHNESHPIWSSRSDPELLLSAKLQNRLNREGAYSYTYTVARVDIALEMEQIQRTQRAGLAWAFPSVRFFAF